MIFNYIIDQGYQKTNYSSKLFFFLTTDQFLFGSFLKTKIENIALILTFFKSRKNIIIQSEPITHIVPEIS